MITLRMTSISLASDPPPLHLSLIHISLDIRPLGAILFLIAISYLIVCKFIHKPIHIFGKEFAFPPFKIAVAQACLLYTSRCV